MIIPKGVYLKILTGLVILALGWCLGLWLKASSQEEYMQELQTALAEQQVALTTLETENQRQFEVIERLDKLRRLDSEAVRTLNDALQDIGEQNNFVREQLVTLERNDEQARSYLNTAIPDNVKCLLEESCTYSDG